MKRLKKFVTLFTLAAVCFAIPGLGKITVKAAEPTTYVLNYSAADNTTRGPELLRTSWMLPCISTRNCCRNSSEHR